MAWKKVNFVRMVYKNFTFDFKCGVRANIVCN